MANTEVFKLAEQIKSIVEKLVVYLKKRSLRGIVRIFFKNEVLIIELLFPRVDE